uniref:RNA-dependent RNA polymerase n=1 Tax=Lutzomyia longipalpis mitovirus 1 TaxID=2748256 RepID=A0A7S4WQR6_9VIRU|nr:TPA_exp: RNA-dependent RNA polymerase [Lutzomyia longipalpis mitovirus 1]
MEAVSVVSLTYKFLYKLEIQAGTRRVLNRLYHVQKESLRKQQPEMIVARFKEDINFIKLYFLTGEKVKIDQSVWWRKVNDGFPSYLYPLSLYEIPDYDKMIILTQLRVYKKFNTPVPLNLVSVVKVISFTNIYHIIKNGNIILKIYDLKLVQSVADLKNIGISIKSLGEIYTPGLQTGSVYSASGPNGSSLVSKIVDLLVLGKHPYFIKILRNYSKNWNKVSIPFCFNPIGSITDPIGLSNYLGIPNIVKKFKDRSTFSSSVQEAYLGKLSYFGDGAGKVRIIAIGNLVIQITLFPLHQLIIKYLKSLKTLDATYNQEIIFDIFKKYRDESMESFCKTNNLPNPLPLDFDFETYIDNNDIIYTNFKAPYSLDLSNATDRIPLGIQFFVLWGFTKRFSVALWWFLIISTLVFKLKLPSGKTIDVKYSTGQGMGLYSSWSILALTHHLLVKLRAFKIGQPDFTDYLILGDDIVIFREEVAFSYIQVITDLGVDISIHKTVKPELGWGSEFASKLVYENNQGLVTNIRPLPTGTLIEGGISSFFNLMRCILSYDLHIHGEPYQFASLLGDIPGKLKKFNKHSDTLSSIWAITHLYQNWYSEKWSQSGSIVLPPNGVILDSVTQYLLENYQIPLSVFMDIEKNYKTNLTIQINKIRKKIIKYSLDYSYLIDIILGTLNKNPEVRENLRPWTEVFLFLQSPWYSVQRILEETTISHLVSTNQVRELSIIIRFLSESNDDTYLLSETTLRNYLNVLSLRWGPGGYLQQKVKSNDPLIKRVSKSKSRIVLKDILVFKSTIKLFSNKRWVKS